MNDVRTPIILGRPIAWCNHCRAKSMPGRRKAGKFIAEHFNNGECCGRATTPMLELVENKSGRLVVRRIR